MSQCKIFKLTRRTTQLLPTPVTCVLPFTVWRLPDMDPTSVALLPKGNKAIRQKSQLPIIISCWYLSLNVCLTLAWPFLIYSTQSTISWSPPLKPDRYKAAARQFPRNVNPGYSFA